MSALELLGPPSDLCDCPVEGGAPGYYADQVTMAVDVLESRIQDLQTENKKLRTENQTLQDALAHWQGVVRVAREKDSTLPDPEAVPC